MVFKLSSSTFAVAPLAFAMVVMTCLVAYSECMPWPVFDQASILEGISHHRGSEEATRMAPKIRSVLNMHESLRSMGNSNNNNMRERGLPFFNFTKIVRSARLVEPDANLIGLERMQRNYPHFWLESRTPLNYSLKIYVPDADGNWGFPILQNVGDFNTSLECRSGVGCVVLSDRSTSTVSPVDGTLSEPTFSQSIFLPIGHGRAVGFEGQLVGSGIFSQEDATVFGPSTNIPVFRNVVNRGSVSTIDTFSTDISPNGGDVGVGSNHYWTETSVDPVTQAITVNIKIQSTFYVIDPATKGPILYADQRTEGSVQAFGLPV